MPVPVQSVPNPAAHSQTFPSPHVEEHDVPGVPDPGWMHVGAAVTLSPPHTNAPAHGAPGVAPTGSQ